MNYGRDVRATVCSSPPKPHTAVSTLECCRAAQRSPEAQAHAPYCLVPGLKQNEVRPCKFTHLLIHAEHQGYSRIRGHQFMLDSPVPMEEDQD